ncbi:MULTISPECIES: DUF2624 family protein [Salipaludibacillus]|uniref:DUF2624 family protein n=1 Tax=Salipaludibacillus TaxID=1884449 RepID=UPI0015FF7A76|nr:DUF2624 family protein [Salipaludibacillus neizhouensis]
MNPFIKDVVNQKIKNLTAKELIRMGRQEGISLTVKEANQILSILHAQPFDISNKNQVNNIKAQLKQKYPQLYQQGILLLKPYEHYLE